MVLVDHGSMSMVIDMNDEKLKILEQIKEFMAGTEGVGFTHQPDRDTRYQHTRYQHISDVLCRLRYYALVKADRGVVLRCLERTTGYSRQQVTRLVRRYLDTGELGKRYKPRMWLFWPTRTISTKASPARPWCTSCRGSVTCTTSGSAFG